MAKLPNGKLEMSAAVKFVNERVTCDKWASIFRQNLESKSGEAHWKFNVEDLAKNMNKRQSDVAVWSSSYGMWPG
jgi:hypothetical protein